VINRTPITTRSGRPVRRTRVVLFSTLAMALVGPMISISVASAQAPVQAGKYSDPLADVAATALNALNNGGGSLLGANGSLKAVPGKSVQAGVAVVPPTPNLTVSTIVGASAAPVVTAVSASQPATAIIQAAVAPAGASWSSTLIATDDLDSFVLGVAVEAPVSPESIATISALPADPSDRYVASLRSLAAMVEARTKVGAAALLKVWMVTDEARMRTILVAMAQVGTAYRYTGNQPGGFDCSGLTSYAWGRSGIKIPRVSGDQIAAAAPRTMEQLLPGDLWYRPGHIGLYLGAGDASVHSPQTGKLVEVKKMGRISRLGSPV
jgi:peptidoglycan DL-endopeptidase CwlO